MLWKFWQNPEFIRHCRSELRRSRMTTVGLVVLFVCALTILACWAAAKAQMTYYHSETLILVQPPAPSGAPAEKPTAPSGDTGQLSRTFQSAEPSIAAATALKSYY